MSLISYFLGSADHSPDSFLIDKSSGAVTFKTFCANDCLQPVPFRMTPMVFNALGQIHTKGSFQQGFLRSLKEIRNKSRSIAPLIQFATSDPPFTSKDLPSSFLASISLSSSSSDSNLDLCYKRLVGNQTSEASEMEQLITQARSVENIAKMPLSWFPWW